MLMTESQQMNSHVIIVEKQQAKYEFHTMHVHTKPDFQIWY